MAYIYTNSLQQPDKYKFDPEGFDSQKITNKTHEQ